MRRAGDGVERCDRVAEAQAYAAGGRSGSPVMNRSLRRPPRSCRTGGDPMGPDWPYPEIRTTMSRGFSAISSWGRGSTFLEPPGPEVLDEDVALDRQLPDKFLVARLVEIRGDRQLPARLHQVPKRVAPVPGHSPGAEGIAALGCSILMTSSPEIGKHAAGKRAGDKGPELEDSEVTEWADTHQILCPECWTLTQHMDRGHGSRQR